MTMRCARAFRHAEVIDAARDGFRARDTPMLTCYADDCQIRNDKIGAI